MVVADLSGVMVVLDWSGMVVLADLSDVCIGYRWDHGCTGFWGMLVVVDKGDGG